MKAADTLNFTTREIPDYVLRNLAMAAYELTQSVLRHPGGRDMLVEITARRRAALAAAEKGGKAS